VPGATDPATQAASGAPTFALPDPSDLDALLDEEFARSIRHDWPLSLLLVEIDHFERINECCGTERSERLRNDISVLLSHNIRASDTIVPQNDNRFVIVLPGGDAVTAATVAQRVVQYARRNISHEDRTGSFFVTVSIGVATRDRNTPYACSSELTAAARNALAHSVQQGRDRHTTSSSIRVA
jgi:diguanylate cyclase (GGDEF)-like protein